MSKAATLVRLANHLRGSRPDLDDRARADLAVEIMRSGGADVNGDGDLLLSDAARALATAPAKTPTTPPATDASRADEIRTSIASETNPSKRAALRADLARATLGAFYKSTLENP